MEGSRRSDEVREVRGAGGAEAKDATLILVGVSNLLARIWPANCSFVLERKFWNDWDRAKPGCGASGIGGVPGASASSTISADRGTARGAMCAGGAHFGGRLDRFAAEWRGVNTSPFGKQ